MAEKQHRLVILGSMDEFVDLVEHAKSRGYYTIVVDGYEDGPAKLHADKAYLEDVLHTDEIVNICKQEEADGIIASFSDLLAECLANIADAAGLRCYIKPEGEVYLREKPLMKKMFSDLGIDSPKFRKVHRETLVKDLEDMEFPCVIKPVNGYGSHGIFVAGSIDDVQKGFGQSVSRSNFDYLMAEEYNSGREFNVITWVADKKAHVLSIADREKETFREGDIPQVTRVVYVSDLSSKLKGEFEEIATKIAGYVGLNDGPLCIQAFYDENRGISVCEAAGRIFGYEHELVTLGSGLHIESLLLDSVYDPDRAKSRIATHDSNFGTIAAGLYFHGYDGEVADVGKMDELSRLDGVVAYQAYYRPGDNITHGPGAKPYVARYYLAAPNREVVDRLSSEIIDQASVLDPDGKELLFRLEKK